MSALCDQARLPLKLILDSDFRPVKTAVANWREAIACVADEAQRPRHELRKLVLGQFELMPLISLGELSASFSVLAPSVVHNAALCFVHQGPLSLDWNKAQLGR